MAARERISPRRYAQALFQLGLERQQLAPWLRDLEALAEAAQLHEFRAYMTSSQVPNSQKEAALAQALSDISSDARKFTMLLAKERAIDSLPAIWKAFQSLMDRHYHRVRADVVTAIPIPDNRKNEIASLLSRMQSGKEVVIETHVDPSIIGGMVIRVGDQLLDGSVRARLRSMKQSLSAQVLRSSAS